MQPELKFHDIDVESSQMIPRAPRNRAGFSNSMYFHLPKSLKM